MGVLQYKIYFNLKRCISYKFFMPLNKKIKKIKKKVLIKHHFYKYFVYVFKLIFIFVYPFKVFIIGVNFLFLY